MKIIVDTDVWSEGLRRPPVEASPERLILADLIQDNQVQMIGCIRQEILQGLRDQAQFERLRSAILVFPDRMVFSSEYELAATFYNTCRRNGVQGSGTDFLIAACSVTWGLPILTKDKDFARYAKHLPLKLVQV